MVPKEAQYILAYDVAPPGLKSEFSTPNPHSPPIHKHIFLLFTHINVCPSGGPNVDTTWTYASLQYSFF